MLAFLTPFFAVSAGAMVVAGKRAWRGEWGEAAPLALFGAIFGSVALLMLLLARAGVRKGSEREAKERQNPDRPWLWRDDWASGRVESSGRATLRFAWAFALFWNLVSAPGIVLNWDKLTRSRDPKVWLLVLFPAVGALLLVWAIRETIRTRKFGVTRFELAHLPGVIGKGVGGLIRTTVPVRPADGFAVRLSCINRVTSGSGKNRTTTEHVRWQDETTVTAFDMDPDTGGTMIPVAFRIPLDQPPCDDRNSNNRILWRLEASADVPGVDFHVAFDVPVFRTEETAEARGEAEEGRTSPPAPFEQPPDSKIRVSELGRGREIVFPPARHPGPAIGITVFAILWTGVLWMLVRLGAPLLFPIVFGVFEILVLVGVVSMWMSTSAVQLLPGRVTIRRGLLVPTRSITLEAGEIAGVSLSKGMQSGTKLYHNIVVETSAGKTVVAGSNVTNRREAEWLKGLIEAAVAGEV